jgi:hypothetical protein
LAEVNKLLATGKLDEAVAAAINVLVIERRVLGDLHENVVHSLQQLARLHGWREDWVAARKALTAVLAIRQRQADQKDCWIADLVGHSPTSIGSQRSTRPSVSSSIKRIAWACAWSLFTNTVSLQRESVRAARP